MSEVFRPSAEQYTSAIEKRAYDELLLAQAAVDTVMRKIQSVYASVPDQATAEATILRTLVPEMKEAKQELNRATDDWMASLRESYQTSSE